MTLPAMANFIEAVRQFFYGMTGHEFELESVFILVTLGDLVGVPVLPPVYALRLLPYVAPEIEKWKRQMARRKEFWEREDFDLHGI